MIDPLWLSLLPVAAASGWYLARRAGQPEVHGQGSPDLRSDYFKGINYLLNEQPDKAIEVFIRVLEVDTETVETHLALGNLYRRRGEVDRAIRIHQNLIARPKITREQRDEALLELGQDYMSAGLLDRAENLFTELVDGDSHRVQALRQLIDIYEQEKDWPKAIDCAHKLEVVTGNQLASVVSLYYCEEAEKEHQSGDGDQALQTVQQALLAYGDCLRASLLEGDILFARGEVTGAMSSYRRVERQAPEFLPEIIERMGLCYDRLGKPNEMVGYLTKLLERHAGVTAALALADIIVREKGNADAIEFVTAHLSEHPSVRGFDRLLQFELAAEENSDRRNRLLVLKQLTDRLLQDRPVYKCQHCGFPAKLLHWQCPGCKHWNTIKPIQGVEGE